MTPSPDETNSYVSAQILNLRKQQGLTQTQLAQLCTDAGMPVSKYVIVDIEKGHRRAVSAGELVVFADVLGVGIARLLPPPSTAQTLDPDAFIKLLQDIQDRYYRTGRGDA